MPRSRSAAELPTSPPPMIATSLSMRRIMLLFACLRAQCEGNRLDRRLRAQAPDRADVAACLIRQYLSCSSTADAALAAAHADPTHRLQAIEFHKPKILDRLPRLAGRDFFAATQQRAVGHFVGPMRWIGKRRFQHVAKPIDPLELAFERGRARRIARQAAI